MIRTLNDTHYEFSAASAVNPIATTIVLGTGAARIVSGGSGVYLGTILGLFATANGGNSSIPAYFERWRYSPIAQKISEGEFVYV